MTIYTNGWTKEAGQVDCDPGEKAQAIRAVLHQLGRYRGRRVAAHKDPLHKAVVELESFCIRRKEQPTDTVEQPYQLWLVAKAQWYGLLWASRGWFRVLDSLRNRRLDGFHVRKINRPDPAWAREKARLLAIELRAELERMGMKT